MDLDRLEQIRASLGVPLSVLREAIQDLARKAFDLGLSVPAERVASDEPEQPPKIEFNNERLFAVKNTGYDSRCASFDG